MFEAVIPFPNFDPVLIHIWGQFGIRWYALSYIAGLLLGWWYVVRLIRDKTLWTAPPFAGKPPLTVDDVGDFVVWATLGVIVGGRLGWVLFYGTFLCSVSPDAGYCHGLPGAFLTDPIRIVAAWEGGMSFHGGLIGVIAGALAVLPAGANSISCASAISSPARRRSGCSSAASPISSTANCGESRPTCPGRWCSARTSCDLWRTLSAATAAPSQPALRSGAWKACCCSSSCSSRLRVFRLHERPGLLGAIFLTGYGTFRFIAEILPRAGHAIHRLVQHRHGLQHSDVAAARSISTGTRSGPRPRSRERARRTHRDADRGARPDVGRAVHDRLRCSIRRDGYYATRDPFGAGGDFITAPEISQMFGELIGLWCVQAWHRPGTSPKRARLVELGPGRGTLMADALRAARLAPEFLEGIEVVMVEASPALRALQQETAARIAACRSAGKTRFDEPSDRPLFLIANEFFDALPIRQFVQTERGWCERMVVVDKGALAFALSPRRQAPCRSNARRADRRRL